MRSSVEWCVHEVVLNLRGLWALGLRVVFVVLLVCYWCFVDELLIGFLLFALGFKCVVCFGWVCRIDVFGLSGL